MNAVFQANVTGKIVDETSTQPVKTDVAGRKASIKENAKAMCIISIALEYSQLEYLITCNTAAEMWAKLSNTHEQKTASNKLLLMQNFYENRMDRNATISQHVAKVKNMAR